MLKICRLIKINHVCLLHWILSSMRLGSKPAPFTAITPKASTALGILWALSTDVLNESA